jgi:rubredoxin
MMKNAVGPHRKIKPGTKFEDLPDDYVCSLLSAGFKNPFTVRKGFQTGISATILLINRNTTVERR